MQAWNPFLKGDVKKIKKVQERATKIPYGFDRLKYKEMLRRLNLTTLKDIRIRGDIIEMYKINKGQEGIEWVKRSRLRSDLGLNAPINGVRGNSQRFQRE